MSIHVYDTPEKLVHHPQPRVCLGERIKLGEIGPPSIAVPVKVGLVAGCNVLTQVAYVLEEVDSETGRDVPGDMAVEEPRAGIVRAEGEDYPALSWQHGYVSTSRIVAVERTGVAGSVERADGTYG